MEETPQYCIVCKKKHLASESGSWPDMWTKKKIGRKTVYYCRHGIDCTGCGFIHYNDTGFTRSYIKDGERVELCGKWAKGNATTPEQRMANMSPEEVMSGVHLGNEMLPYFKGKSSNNYSDEVREQRKELKEALK
jgi:uncharacterized protein YeaC (DUF1315 family)